MLDGVFLLLAFTRLGHGCQDISVPAIKCMRAQTRPQFILSSERAAGTGIRIYVNSKEKSPQPDGSEENRIRDAASRWSDFMRFTNAIALHPVDAYFFVFVCLLVGCLTSQQHASVSQGRICSYKFTCCHAEIEVADPTFNVTQSQHTDIGPTTPSTDPITPGAWQVSHWSANFEVTGMTRPRKNPCASWIRTRDLPLSRRTP